MVEHSVAIQDVPDGMRELLPPPANSPYGRARLTYLYIAMAAPKPAATATIPFGLRPWPQGDRKPKNLAEFISRINIERKGFRNVTEESLRAEIAAQQGEETGKDAEDEEANEDEDEEKDIRVVRDQMLRDAEFVLLLYQNGCSQTIL
jgi:hypothetical protein